MIGALIILGGLVTIGVILYISDRLYFKPREERRQAATESAEEEESANEEEECCGMHITCEKDSLSPFTTEAEYYDDEELDRFRGREADDYTAEEIEEFRDIMLTMRVEEIAGWVRALQVRGVTLPGDIREEVLMIVSEARASR